MGRQQVLPMMITQGKSMANVRPGERDGKMKFKEFIKKSIMQSELLKPSDLSLFKKGRKKNVCKVSFLPNTACL